MEKIEDLYPVKLLSTKGINFSLIQLTREPKSANDIASMVGCRVNQIIKTLLFIGEKKVIVCVSGDSKVNLDKLKAVINVSYLNLANKQGIQKLTGYEQGGLSPFINNPAENLEMIIDSKCFNEGTVNLGAGSKLIGIKMLSKDLRTIWSGVINDIT